MNGLQMLSNLQRVIDDELAKWGVNLLDVVSRESTSLLRGCRASIALRCRDDLKLSYHDIGQVLGGRHHTTIMSIIGRRGWQR